MPTQHTPVASWGGGLELKNEGKGNGKGKDKGTSKGKDQGIKGGKGVSAR